MRARQSTEPPLDAVAHDRMPDRIGDGKPHTPLTGIGLRKAMRDIPPAGRIRKVTAMSRRRHRGCRRIRSGTHDALRHGLTCRLPKGVMDDDVGTGDPLTEAKDIDELEMTGQSLHHLLASYCYPRNSRRDMDVSRETPRVRNAPCTPPARNSESMDAPIRSGRDTRPDHSVSGAENLTALRAATVDDGTTGTGAHARAEAVLHVTTTIVRLECPLHGDRSYLSSPYGLCHVRQLMAYEAKHTRERRHRRRMWQVG